MKKIVSYVLLSLMLVFASSQGCNSFFGGDLIESGKYAFVNPLTQKSFSFTFTAIVHFTIPSTGLQAAVTTSTIAGYNPLVGSGYNQFFTANRVGSTNNVLFELATLDDYSWTSIQVGYIFTGRQDLALGNIDFDIEPANLISPNTYRFTVGIVSSLPAAADYQVVAFISGMSVVASDFTLRLNEKYYNKVTKVLTLIAESSTNTLSAIIFSYIIYPSQHSVFSFVTRDTPQGNEAYHLSGPVSFTGKVIKYTEWAIKNRALSCTGPACSSPCVKTEECIATFGNVWETKCIYCAPGVIFERGICTRKCGANQLFFRGACVCPDATFIRVGTDCIKQAACGPNQSRVVDKCVCDAEYALWQDVCRKCPAGSAATADRSTCNCGPGFTFDSINNVCVNKCVLGQSWSIDRCICSPGWIFWNLNCKQCPANSNPNADKTTCVCTNSNFVYFSIENQCKACPNIMIPNAARTACDCPVNTKNVNEVCVTDCPINRVFSLGKCICQFGFLEVGILCVERCGINQVWSGTACVCKPSFAFYNGACRECPTLTSTVSVKADWCLCNAANQIFNPQTGVCQQCVANSAPDAEKRICSCIKDFSSVSGVCVKINNCPLGAAFNPTTLRCVCTDPTKYLINGACNVCPANEGWNGTECVCISNTYRVSGVCRTCDPRTIYNGTDCVCSLGFFGNRDLCQSCHATCSRCKGPGAGQCTACADITLILRDGFCSQEGPCPIGSYLLGASCRECLPYCQQCTGELDCQKCAPGFQANTITFGGQVITTCDQVCGDSRRYEQECDDGNVINGDGCSSECKIQSGFSCTGGTSIKKDTCVGFIPGTYLEAKGSVNTGTKVTQSVRASYLPTCITNLQCTNCADALEVRVVQSLIPITVSISFVFASKYQFYVEYIFPQGVFVTSAFRVSIRLNRKYSSCFQANDFNQVIDMTIDPATLALCNPTQTLTSINDLPTAKIASCFKKL